MAFVKFVGDPNGDPKQEKPEVTNWDYVFPRNEFVEVDDDAVVAKARTHSHFVVKDTPPEPTKPVKTDGKPK